MEHINNIKSHAQTLRPCLIVVTCKTEYGQFWVTHLLLKKQQNPK